MNEFDKYKAGHALPLEDRFWTRRQFLQRAGMGFGALSLAALFGNELFAPAARAAAAEATLLPKAPPFPAKAKRVMHIFAQGAPSHVDTWDPKPSLAKYDGQPMPGMDGVAMASPFKFSPQGQVRHRGQRSVPATWRTGGRHVRDPLDVHRHPRA